MAGLEPLVVFWTGWGIHFMVLVSFTVQVTLLLASDFRRRKDWAVLKVIVWSAYMLADTTAIYALGHMSVVCRFAEHQLMALWAPLLLVHLGGQDNISAYAIEDNRLWLRHLQTFVLQVTAAIYVLYVSSILSKPSKVSWAAILMLVVGVLKYAERIWALMCADSRASSSLYATSYSKVLVSRSIEPKLSDVESGVASWNTDENDPLIIAYSLLDVPKQMFEGPTTYVQLAAKNRRVAHDGEFILDVLKLQLSMMYDLLYTKAAVVHTWYGLCSRVLITLPFTVTALGLFRSASMSHAAAGYKTADVAITNVLLVGAVILETMSVLRAIFSKWIAVLLLAKDWDVLASVVYMVEILVIRAMKEVVRSEAYWSGRMRQHSFFGVMLHSDYSRGSKMAKRIGVEDWWDSNAYSWSTRVPELVIPKVLELVSTTEEDITKSWGQSALRRGMSNDDRLVSWIWKGDDLKLEESILVWHIATHIYISSYRGSAAWEVQQAAMALANYMLFLLAARPYMLPYPVSRQAYVQLCSDAVTHLRGYSNVMVLHKAISKQKEDLIKGISLQLDKEEETTGAQPPPSMNTTLDRGCQLAAKLIHITTGRGEEPRRKKQREQGVDDTEEEDITEQARSNVEGEVVLNMILEVWVEMLCYTAYLCNENSHAKRLTDGGEIMTIITLLMIYMKNGLIIRQKHKCKRKSSLIFSKWLRNFKDEASLQAHRLSDDFRRSVGLWLDSL